MFSLCQRSDTMPEMRVLVNTDHLVAAVPTNGGVRTKLLLDNGESWEISLPFTRAVNLFRQEADITA